MSFNAQLLPIAIATPLVAALIIALGLPKRFSTKLAGVAFVVPALIALWLWKEFPAGGGADYQFLSSYDTGLANFGITLKLGLNGIALPMFALAGIVGLAAGLYALRSGAERLKLYLTLLLVMHGGLMGVFASVDIFFFYFFHELALIPTFIMVGIWGGRDRNYAAMKMTIYLTVGAMLSLIGLIAIYVKSGENSFDLITLKEAIAARGLADTTQNYIFGLLMFGFGILVSLWPLHTWAPLGYGAAPSSAAMLHAGVLKKFGLYGLIQIALPLLPEGAAHWAWKLALLAGIGNVLVVGFVTIAQRDLKQMLGYSSVMHMGYAFLGIATMSVIGVGGVVLLMVAHGLSVALLFLLATSIHHRTHTFDLTEMGGLAQKTPVLAAFFVAATMASVGLPGFANFWGELAVFVSLWNFSPAITAVAVAGVVISAIYGLRAAARVFFGPASEKLQQVTAQHPPVDLSWGEKIPALILIIALLVFGFYPKLLSEPVNDALKTPAAAAVAAPQTSVSRT
ncbi:complex I subunit 4 family protein [Oleiharenicola lentus]|uniref:complex I subunit 4 family protein n=1 Tax=Oleiharenicola lentus TaxID=2508720 RepID=UPI003F67CDA1